MRKYYYYIAGVCFLLLSVATLLNINILPQILTNAIYKSQSDEISGEQLKKFNEIYDVSFLMPRSSIGSAAVYLPKYQVHDEAEALHYATIFDMQELVPEDLEEYYLYQNGGESLHVYKYLDFIQYHKKDKTGIDRHLTDTQLILEAEQFINEHFLYMSYGETVVRRENNTVAVRFISKLSNMPNYAFPTTVTLNMAGEVIGFDYYYFTYERIGTANIKTMKQAFKELPIVFDDLREQPKIDLKKYALVYSFENSILQPSYLFEGEIAGGKTYQCFVNALYYN